MIWVFRATAISVNNLLIAVFVLSCAAFDAAFLPELAVVNAFLYNPAFAEVIIVVGALIYPNNRLAGIGARNLVAEIITIDIAVRIRVAVAIVGRAIRNPVAFSFFNNAISVICAAI